METCGIHAQVDPKSTCSAEVVAPRAPLLQEDAGHPGEGVALAARDPGRREGDAPNPQPPPVCELRDPPVRNINGTAEQLGFPFSSLLSICFLNVLSAWSGVGRSHWNPCVVMPQKPQLDEAFVAGNWLPGALDKAVVRGAVADGWWRLGFSFLSEGLCVGIVGVGLVPPGCVVPGPRGCWRVCLQPQCLLAMWIISAKASGA